VNGQEVEPYVSIDKWLVLSVLYFQALDAMVSLIAMGQIIRWQCFLEYLAPCNLVIEPLSHEPFAQLPQFVPVLHSSGVAPQLGRKDRGITKERTRVVLELEVESAIQGCGSTSVQQLGRLLGHVRVTVECSVGDAVALRRTLF
jgi:hypothetical protein